MRCIQSAEGDVIKSWSGAKARSSLHSKRSVILPLWIHSGFSIPAHGKTAPCPSHLNVIRNSWEEKKHCSAGTPKIFPASAAASHWQHSNAARIIHGLVLSREHRAKLEFRLLIIIILIPAGSDRMPHLTYHICTCFWVLRTHSRALNFCAPTDHDKEIDSF